MKYTARSKRATNRFYFPHAVNDYKLILGQNDELHLNVTVINKNESAYESQLFVEHNASVSYIGASKGSVICNRFNATIVACTLGNPLRRDAAAYVKLRFDPSGLEGLANTMAFRIFANTTSVQRHANDAKSLNVRVIKKAEVSIRGWAQPEQSFYGGEVRGESAMGSLDDIGTAVTHTYQIYNDGPWKAPYLEVNILWPHQVANDKPQGKWLLYLEDRPTIEGGGGGECDLQTNGAIFNPLQLQRTSVVASQIADLQPMKYSRLVNMNKTVSISASSIDAADGKSEFAKLTAAPQMNRVKRDRAMIIRPERLVDKDGKKTDVVNMVSFYRRECKYKKWIGTIYLIMGCIRWRKTVKA